MTSTTPWITSFRIKCHAQSLVFSTQMEPSLNVIMLFRCYLFNQIQIMKDIYYQYKKVIFELIVRLLCFFPMTLRGLWFFTVLLTRWETPSMEFFGLPKEFCEKNNIYPNKKRTSIQRMNPIRPTNFQRAFIKLSLTGSVSFSSSSFILMGLSVCVLTKDDVVPKALYMHKKISYR